MVELKHPHIRDLVIDKPSEVVGKWEKAGWLRVKPLPPKPEPKPEKQDKTTE